LTNDNFHEGSTEIHFLAALPLAAKAETMMLLELHSSENPDSVRRCTILT
jgi:hypothetical protein